MLTRSLSFLSFAAVAAALVLFLGGSGDDAHAGLHVPVDEAAPDYIPEDAMGAGDASAGGGSGAEGASGSRGADGPTLIGRAPTGKSPEEIAEELIQEFDVELAQPAIEGIRVTKIRPLDGRLTTLLERLRGLDLTPDERAAVMRVLEALADRIRDLGETPNDQGQTYDRAKHGSWGVALETYMSSTVPGWGETYRDAGRRMAQRAVEEVAAALPAEKAALWNKLAKKSMGSNQVFELPNVLQGIAKGRSDIDLEARKMVKAKQKVLIHLNDAANPDLTNARAVVR